jgi:putative FmdB family regulatory protein
VPIYEYRCSSCNRGFEELVSVSAAEQPHDCPACGASAPRVLSTFAVRVAGSSSGGTGKSCSGCRKSSCASC